jgi:hypothetical protein
MPKVLLSQLRWIHAQTEICIVKIFFLCTCDRDGIPGLLSLISFDCLSGNN